MLELGCGDGRLTLGIARDAAHVLAFDPDAEAVVEVDGRPFCEIDGEPLFRGADAATAAVDALVGGGRLREEAVDDHDVRNVGDFAGKQRKLPGRWCHGFDSSSSPAPCGSAAACGG